MCNRYYNGHLGTAILSKLTFSWKTDCLLSFSISINFSPRMASILVHCMSLLQWGSRCPAYDSLSIETPSVWSEYVLRRVLVITECRMEKSKSWELVLSTTSASLYSSSHSLSQISGERSNLGCWRSTVAVQNAAIPPTLYAAAAAGMFSSGVCSGFSVLCLNLHRNTQRVCGEWRVLDIDTITIVIIIYLYVHTYIGQWSLIRQCCLCSAWCMINITGVVGGKCVLFYIPKNFNVKVRLLGQVKRTNQHL